jgi:hypothetical protein
MEHSSFESSEYLFQEFFHLILQTNVKLQKKNATFDSGCYINFQGKVKEMYASELQGYQQSKEGLHEVQVGE